MKTKWLILSVLFLSGCATFEWIHPTKSKTTFYEEKLACEETANRLAWQRFPQPQNVTINKTTVQVQNNSDSAQNKDSSSKHEDGYSDPDSYSRSSYQDDRFEDCMKSKGWMLVEVKR